MSFYSGLWPRTVQDANFQRESDVQLRNIFTNEWSKRWPSLNNTTGLEIIWQNVSVRVSWCAPCVLPCCKPYHDNNRTSLWGFVPAVLPKSSTEEFSLPTQPMRETRSCAGLCNSTCADLLTRATLFKHSSMESTSNPCNAKPIPGYLRQSMQQTCHLTL